MRTACGHLRARSACMRAAIRCEDQRLYEAARADAKLGGGAQPRAGEATRTDGRFVEAEQLNYVHRRHPRVHCAVPCGTAPRAHPSPQPHPSFQPTRHPSLLRLPAPAPTQPPCGAGVGPACRLGAPWRLLPGSRHGAGVMVLAAFDRQASRDQRVRCPPAEPVAGGHASAARRGRGGGGARAGGKPPAGARGRGLPGGSCS